MFTSSKKEKNLFYKKNGLFPENPSNPFVKRVMYTLIITNISRFITKKFTKD